MTALSGNSGGGLAASWTPHASPQQRDPLVSLLEHILEDDSAQPAIFFECDPGRVVDGAADYREVGQLSRVAEPGLVTRARSLLRCLQSLDDLIRAHDLVGEKLVVGERSFIRGISCCGCGIGNDDYFEAIFDRVSGVRLHAHIC